MALRLSTDLKNEVVNRLVDALAGTCGSAGTASLLFYSGAQPASADSAPSGTCLATIIGIGWGTDAFATTNGTAGIASTAYVGTCGTSGTAGWARCETVTLGYTGSAATLRIDGDVGTGATCTFVVNSTEMTSAGLVSLLTASMLLS